MMAKRSLSPMTPCCTHASISTAQRCPKLPLQAPQGKPDPRVQELLDGQDVYHMDIRNLIFRYILPPFVVIKKSTNDLAKMDAEDAGGKVKGVAGGGQGLISNHRRR